jgi:hypothetical protein
MLAPALTGPDNPRRLELPYERHIFPAGAAIVCPCRWTDKDGNLQ